MDISSNRLSGSIPGILLQSSLPLSRLELSNNSLTGPLPKGLFQNPVMKYLGISLNPLNCTIPAFNVTNNALTTLYINGSGLVANINDTLGHLTSLNIIDLANNNLNGTIPPSMGSAKRIYLNGNNLSGTIPDTIISKSNLQDLYLYSNRLTGTLKPFASKVLLNV